MRAAIIGADWQQQFMASDPCDSYTYFRGGILQLEDFIERNHGNYIIGMLSYDLGYELLNITQTKNDGLGLPDAYFLAFDTIQDPELSSNESSLASPFLPTLSRTDYNSAFTKIKHYIYEGDIYQANLTHRLEAESHSSAWDIFSSVTRRNPSAMAAFLEGPDFDILSFSPEKFITINGRSIETTPIKGTCLSGHEAVLLASEKEAAELNMITDLLRNDLGKVCIAGSVNVSAHREIMKLPNISHTYSRIAGELKPDFSPIAALLSMFPGGSITGCPKKRAMEVIDELEQTTRSAYCGCMVTIDPSGNLDSSILIRTIIKKDTRLVLPVGGGIVNDSQQNDEYEETLAKAQSIITALSE